ncbi:rhodanese-like domain-containing protein [Aureibaculum sp. 2210JD6-5]|uniref:rhodanese-like domain-containing protein n=1 Tax=Aureibaculum sp. 2210JD6-5 TaxID=3103957 RepID=UPI002AAC9D39|nr:rhodanese-like domain-containing protein [Aureibaculum sp. 2210JD6-5]MDY7396225.1 rhodanese-like domain-containing protein [Aureibaculum sp. 2210JD6-5]
MIITLSCQEKTKQEKLDETVDYEEIVEVEQESIVEVVTPQDFKKKVDNTDVQLIDVRRPEEYKAGHLKNSKNINVLEEDFVKNAETTLDKNKPVYLYCRSGKRSEKASSKLKEAGFTKIYDMEGGFLAWSAENLEIEKEQ